MVEANHLPHLISLIVNDGFFQDLSQEDQAIMAKAAQSAYESIRKTVSGDICQAYLSWE